MCMAIPDYQTIMLPLLKRLEDKQTYKISELIDKLSDEFRLTDEEKEMVFESGNGKIFRNRVRWARTYLKKAGLVDDPKRGYLVITTKGLEALKLRPQKIDLLFLKKYPEFTEFKNNKVELEEKAFDGKTPDDLIEEGYNQIKNNLKQELLKLLRENSADFFEDTVVKLLQKMGYGTGEVTGKSGDGGIDGVISQDKLGLEFILLQAKRYGEKNTVGSKEVREFRGALDSKNATKGVFFTTSTFTDEAKKEATTYSKNIQLIDGDKLVELMIDYNIGVIPHATYEIKKVNHDFFSEIYE